MGSSSSTPKQKKPRRYLVICGRPVCAGDAVVSSNNSSRSIPTETVEDLLERRRSVLQAYAASQQHESSPSDSFYGDDEASDTRSVSSSVRGGYDDHNDKSAEMGYQNDAARGYANPFYGYHAPQEMDPNGVSNIDGLGEFGIDSGDVLMSESESSQSGSAAHGTSTSSSSYSSSEESEEGQQFSEWHRPIYIPLNESERAVVRDARRRRSTSVSSSQAGQMAKRNGPKIPRPTVQDLSRPTSPVDGGGGQNRLSRKNSRRGSMRGGDDFSEDAPRLRRRSSSVRFTEAVVVGTASSVRYKPNLPPR